MVDHFLDTTALGKHYHPEVGTAKVDQLLHGPGFGNYISRLTALEIQSVFAKKVRTGIITAADFQALRRRFLADLSKRKFIIVRITNSHYQEAERLLCRHGLAQGLRTLDALQLSVALDLRGRGKLDHFVCSDTQLCGVAGAEGLSVINPEVS